MREGVAGVGTTWDALAARASPVAIDTGTPLNRAVARVLAGEGVRKVLVLTDKALSSRDRRVTRLQPEEPVGGVGIVGIAARERPRPQLLLRIVNRSERTDALLRVSSAGQAVDHSLRLPKKGTVGLFFVDVHELGPTVSAAIDGTVVDGRAWLARLDRLRWVAATPGCDARLRRVAEVYNRPIGQRTGRPIVLTDQPLATDEAGVWVVDDVGRGVAVGPTSVVDSPVTRGVVHWPAGGGTAPPGWAAKVSRGGRTMVAVRDGSPRQVWVAVNVTEMSASADWVVLMANAFRWVGEATQDFRAESPHLLGPGWERVDGTAAPANVEAGLWPGLYRSPGGETVAVNATVATPLPAVTSEVADVLDPGATATRAPLGGPLSIVAECMLALGAAAGTGGLFRSVAKVDSGRGRS
jgi:hypothetical protein